MTDTTADVLADKTIKYFYDEPGREVIYVWTKRRIQKINRSLWNHLRLYLFSLKTLKHIFGYFSIFVLLNMTTSMLITGLLIHFDLGYNIPAILYMQVFSLSISFAIYTNFDRKEKIQTMIAEFRAGCLITMLMVKSWYKKLSLSESNYVVMVNVLIRILVHLDEYLLCDTVGKALFIQKVIYEDISDISFHINKYGINKMDISIDNHTPTIWLISSRIHAIFERLRVLKAYRSPLTDHSFNKCIGFVIPLIFSPWFSYMSNGSKGMCKWFSVVYMGLFTFIISQLLIINDNLFDPLTCPNCDGIKKSEMNQWINDAVKYNINRLYKMFEFSVPIPCGKAFIRYMNTNGEEIEATRELPFKVDMTEMKYKKN